MDDLVVVEHDRPSDAGVGFLELRLALVLRVDAGRDAQGEGPADPA